MFGLYGPAVLQRPKPPMPGALQATDLNSPGQQVQLKVSPYNVQSRVCDYDQLPGM
jgi:hypothetical protein